MAVHQAVDLDQAGAVEVLAAAVLVAVGNYRIFIKCAKRTSQMVSLIDYETLFGVAPDCQPQLALQEHADWGANASQGVDAASHQWLHADAHRAPRAGYCLHLTALSDYAHIDLISMIGQPLLLEWQTDADRRTLRPLHGHITAAQLLAVNGGFARYGFVVEPALAWLSQRNDSWEIGRAHV